MSSFVLPNRDLAGDLLRGGAVLYIVGYYHIQDVWLVGIPSPLAGWFARVALALFCFLSAYFLSAKTIIKGGKDVLIFYRRRLLKIYPLYFLALVGFVALGLVDKNLFWPSALLINTILNWNLLTLWFVSMVFLFYLITPLFLWRSSITKTCLLTLVFLVILGLTKFFAHGIDPRFFPNLVAFAFGILMTQSPRLFNLVMQPGPQVKSVCLFAFVFLFALQWQTLPHDNDWTHMVCVLAWFGATLPWLMITARGLVKIFPAKSIEFLATASFVLYLSHRIIYHLGEQIWPAPSPLSRQFYYLVVLLPAALVISFALQKAYLRLVK